MLSFADFCAAFAEHVRRARPDVKLEAEGGVGTYSLIAEDGTRASLSLHNAYRFYEAAPEEVASLFDRALALSKPMGKLSPDQLVAMVRCSDTLSADTAIIQEFAPGLVLAVAADLGDRFVFPTVDNLADAAIDRSNAIRHAVRNVDKFVGDVSAHDHPSGFRVFGSANDMSSSLIVSERFLDFAHNQAAGEPVFILVGRNFLVVGDTANPSGVRTMCELAKTVEPGPHPISSDPIVFRNGRWTSFFLQ